MEQKVSIWQVLFYLSTAVLTLWLILKVTGVINTPEWLGFGVPIASVIIGVFALYHNLIEKMNQLGINMLTLNSKFDHLDIKVDNLDIKVDHLDKKVDHLDEDVEFLKKRMAA